MFKKSAVQNYIEFKWSTVGWNTHITGFIVHIIYIIGLMIYTESMYIENHLGYTAPDNSCHGSGCATTARSKNASTPE